MNKIIMEQQPRKRCNSLPVPRAEVCSQGSPDVKRKYCKEVPISCNPKGTCFDVFILLSLMNFLKSVNDFQILHFVRRNTVNMENMRINTRKNARKVTSNHLWEISYFHDRKKI